MLQTRVEDDNNEVLKLFHYYPNKSLALGGLLVLPVFAIYLTVCVYVSKSRRFLYILPVTAVMECIRYLIRYLSSKSVSLGSYIGMTMFLLLSPNALALVNYKAVGEIIQLSNVQGSRVFLRPKFVTWFFFSSNAFSFFCKKLVVDCYHHLDPIVWVFQ
jgi:hypothetical protein